MCVTQICPQSSVSLGDDLTECLLCLSLSGDLTDGPGAAKEQQTVDDPSSLPEHTLDTNQRCQWTFFQSRQTGFTHLPSSSRCPLSWIHFNVKPFSIIWNEGIKSGLLLAINSEDVTTEMTGVTVDCHTFFLSPFLPCELPDTNISHAIIQAFGNFNKKENTA